VSARHEQLGLIKHPWFTL